MKTRNIALLMLITVVAFSGCKKIEDALDVTFDTSFFSDLNAVVTEGTKSGINGTFNVETSLDPTSDDNVAKYMDKIKSWEVTKIKAEIISTSKDATLTILNLGVANQNYSANWDFQNIAISVGTIITLDNENGQWNSINSILGDMEVFTFTTSGTTEEDQLEFKIRIEIDSEVTANPL